MILIWRARAEHDLDHLIRYIAQFNVKAAIDLDFKIERAVARLAQSPYMGTVIHDGITRKLVVTPNVKLLYRVHPKLGEVEVIRVLHTRRKHP
jgi:plasmid stabilization system protein ParE